jgi:ABC-type uncharacterized transport system permease subunit
MNILVGNSAKGSFSKIKAAFMAISFGLLIGTIPIFINGGNPISGYYTLFTSGFDKLSLNKFIV